MKNRFFLQLIWLAMLICMIAGSCTKLDPKVYDQVVTFWNSPDQIAAGVAPAYSGLRDYAPFNGAFGPGAYALNELSSDEIILPTRGGDWADNGLWEEMWKHTWTATNPVMENGWQFIYGGSARVNNILQSVGALNPKPINSPSIEAELKIVRAFYHYTALDLFGNVPIFDSNYTEPSKLQTKQRSEVFSFVEKEIKDNLPYLSSEVSQKTYGRATRWVAYSLLAKLYLNAAVFSGTSRWSDCIAACDSVLNSNQFSLEQNFFSNFVINNEGSRENVFVIPFDDQKGLNYFWLQVATLHYNSGATFNLVNGGANGLCSTVEYYNLFDANDLRRNMFLVGQQFVNQIRDSAHIQYDGQTGLRLIFDPTIKTFSISDASSKTAGARCAKWQFNSTNSGNMSNDYAVYRLADIILMKAEAQFRLGNMAGALATINQKINGVSIRSRAGMPDFSMSEMNADGLLAERARELSWEGFRRNDMIRLGHFTDARIPEKALSGNFRILYPIPQSELSKNPYLKQNPGY